MFLVVALLLQVFLLRWALQVLIFSFTQLQQEILLSLLLRYALSAVVVVDLW